MNDNITPKKKDALTGRNYVIIEGKKMFTDELVARTFIPNPNPDRYTRVEHIDGDLGNDDVRNLRWVE